MENEARKTSTNGSGNGAGHASAHAAAQPDLPLRALFDATRVNFVYCDAHLTIRYVNRATEETVERLKDELEISADQLLGEPIDVLRPFTAPERRALRSGKPLEVEAPLGAETVRLHASPVQGPGGELQGVCVTFELGTGTARASSEEARLFQMLEGVPINVMWCDAEMTIRYINPASRRTLERLEQHLPVPADRVVGSSIDIFHKHPAHPRRVLGDLRGRTHRADVRLGPETLGLTICPLTGTDGAPLGMMLTWEVLTEKLDTERRVKEANEREHRTQEDLRQRVEAMLGVVRAATHGDLTTAVTVSGDDTVGQMGAGLAAFLADLRKSISTIGLNAQTLGASAEELTSVSQSMAAGAEETSAQAGVVSTAADQVNVNIQTVASSADEMSASIREISKNAGEAARVATSAVKVAETTNATVAKLGESSAEIGKVIKVITSIAQQTNLLALNATIEAARAGEAGKGFAVVANEVKELAKETAKATEDISQKIEAIQADTRGAVVAIGQIGAIIREINDIQSTIASAVEEQTATTNEISRNVAEAARGSSEIAHNITGVAAAARSTSSGASDTQNAASELSRMAAELQGLVARFTY